MTTVPPAVPLPALAALNGTPTPRQLPAPVEDAEVVPGYEAPEEKTLE